MWSRKKDISASEPEQISMDNDSLSGLELASNRPVLTPIEVGVSPTEYFERYGLPTVVHDMAVREEYVSYFDRRNRNPWWVIEHLTTKSLSENNANRRQSFFTEDSLVPDMFKAKLRDYFRSGYDRGHMAPAADAKFSQEAMDETFYLTNMCPQVGQGFNQDYWAHLEQFARNLTHSYESVRVVSGPLYLPKKQPDGKWRVSYQMIGNPPNVAVPTHFFKIFIGENPIPSRPVKGVAVGAFVLPNEPISNSTPLKSFYVPLDMIERSAGLEFLPKLPVSQRRDLCKEVACDITVREFKKAVDKLPPSRDFPQLPAA